MKRYPRVFYLIRLLLPQEKDLIIKIISASGSAELLVSKYIQALMECETLKCMHHNESKWREQNNISSRTLWTIRNRAYNIIITLLDELFETGRYVHNALRLNRVRLYLSPRVDVDKAIPNVYASIKPDDYKIWFFYPPYWWYEYVLRFYALINTDYNQVTLVDQAQKAIALSTYAFKMLSMYRLIDKFAPDKYDLRLMFNDIKRLCYDFLIPMHHSVVLFHVAVFIILGQLSIFDAMSNLSDKLRMLFLLTRQFEQLSIKKYKIPGTDLSFFKVISNRILNALFNFPELRLFIDPEPLHNLAKQIASHEKYLFVSHDYFATITRLGWWNAMNGYYELAKSLLKQVQEHYETRPAPTHYKDMYHCAMAWIEYVTTKDRRIVARHIQNLSFGHASIHHVVYNLYNMLFSIENKDFKEVWRAGETIYRFSVRHGKLTEFAKAIRWFAHNYIKNQNISVWQKFHDKLIQAYIAEPQSIHIEALLPIETILTSRIKNVELKNNTAYSQVLKGKLNDSGILSQIGVGFPISDTVGLHLNHLLKRLKAEISK